MCCFYYYLLYSCVSFHPVFLKQNRRWINPDQWNDIIYLKVSASHTHMCCIEQRKNTKGPIHWTKISHQQNDRIIDHRLSSQFDIPQPYHLNYSRYCFSPNGQAETYQAAVPRCKALPLRSIRHIRYSWQAQTSGLGRVYWVQRLWPWGEWEQVCSASRKMLVTW